MGIFTDENHIERIQTADWEEKLKKLKGPVVETLTEENVRADIEERFWENIGAILVLLVALIPLSAAFAIMRAEWQLRFAYCVLYIAPLVPGGVFFAVRAVRYSGFNRKKIYVQKDVVNGVSYNLSGRYKRATITFRTFKTLNMPNKTYFSWSKRYGCNMEDMLKYVGNEMYVVSFDQVNAVAAYPCQCFRWEKEELTKQEESL